MQGGVITLDFTILWQALNIVILYYLLRRFLYRPLVEFMEKRRSGIQNDITEAERLRKEAEELKEHYEERINAARKEASEILEKATRESREIIAAGRQKAREESEQILEKARRDLELEKNKVFKELHDEVALISVQIAERILEKEIDLQAQRELVDRYIKEVEKAS